MNLDINLKREQEPIPTRRMLPGCIQALTCSFKSTCAHSIPHQIGQGCKEGSEMCPSCVPEILKKEKKKKSEKVCATDHGCQDKCEDD